VWYSIIRKGEKPQEEKQMSELERLLNEGGMDATDAKVIAILVGNGVPLPQAMQLTDSIKTTLAVYNTTNVWLENGRYDQTPHTALRSTYAADHKFIATIKDSDIYTAEQIKQNLVELSKATWLD
jgi:hypothetical protein